jgi:hypothetical protein
MTAWVNLPRPRSAVQPLRIELPCVVSVLRHPISRAQQGRREDRARHTVDEMQPCAGWAGDGFKPGFAPTPLHEGLNGQLRLGTPKLDRTIR